MINQDSLIDEVLGFDPSSLNAFQEKGPKVDPNIYKTNPKNSKADDGIYRSVVKILLNPFAPKDSIVPQANYWLNSMDGSRLVRSSLSIGDKQCPLFKCWKRLWFSGNEEKKNWSKQIFQKTESNWVLVQVLEDENQPEAVGQFKVMKLPRDVYDKLVARMNPSAESKKKPYPVMDYLVGLALNIEVTPGPDDPKNPERKQREISYSLCDFGDWASVIKTDGSSLITEDETELVDQYVTAYNDSQNGKTQKKKDEATKKLSDLKPQLIPIYRKVISYVEENLKDAVTGEKLDIVKYCGFNPWDDGTREFVNHWIEMVDAGVDPATESYDTFKSNDAKPEVSTEESKIDTPVVDPQPSANTEDDELPF